MLLVAPQGLLIFPTITTTLQLTLQLNPNYNTQPGSPSMSPGAGFVTPSVVSSTGSSGGTSDTSGSGGEEEEGGEGESVTTASAGRRGGMGVGGKQLPSALYV